MSRDLYWDTLKFVLIFLVVLGHTIEKYAMDGTVLRALYNFIFMFHMPLFIFISGRFSHYYDQDKFVSGIVRLLETYFVFQLFKYYYPAITHGTFSLKSLVLFLVYPKWTMWYLLSLVFWRLLVLVIPYKILKNNAFTILFLCFAISIAGGFLPTIISRYLSIQRTLAYLPFFFLGYYSTSVDYRALLRKIPIAVPVIVLLAAFLVIYRYYDYEFGYVLSNARNYWDRPLPPAQMCLARVLYLACSMTIGVMVLRLVKTNPTVASWGTKTLVIYVFHASAIYLMQDLIAQGTLPCNDYLLILYAVVITFGLLLIAQSRFLVRLLNPFTYVFGRRYYRR